MAIQYEEYVWRLTCTNPVMDIQLPQDLEWVDEFSWSPIQQTVETTLTGALVVQESEQLRGKPITLVGKDNMAWIQRPIGEQLMTLRNKLGCVMNLQFIKYVDGSGYSGLPLHEYDVMFRHYEPPPLELESVLRYDNFESTAWYKVRNIKFMETISQATGPCTANVEATLTSITGTFSPGDTVTEHAAGTDCTEINGTGVSGTVLSISGSTLSIYIAVGTLTVGNLLCVDAANYGTIDSLT